jgi:hypothetical protein
VDFIDPPFFSSALDGAGWSSSRPAFFNAGELFLSTYCIGGWFGPITCLDAMEKRKILSLQGMEPLIKYSKEGHAFT